MSSDLWCLQPSIIQQWKRLQAWFLYCLTSVLAEMCLFANCSSYVHSKHHGTTFALLCFSSFCWQCKVSICNSVKWLPTGFFWSDMDSLQESFLHCYLSVMLCNEQSMKHKTTHFSVHDWSLGSVMASFWLFAHTFCSNWENFLTRL